MKHKAGLYAIPTLLSNKEALRVFETDIAALKQYLLTTFKMRPGPLVTAYHALSRGFFVDVLCVAVDGRRIRDFIQEVGCLFDLLNYCFTIYSTSYIFMQCDMISNRNTHHHVICGIYILHLILTFHDI
jgi:hypothetical protein